MFSFRSLVVVLSISSVVQGLPTFNKREAVTQEQVDLLEYFSQFSAAAYCPENNTPNSNTNITCEAGNCPMVADSASQTIVEWQNIGIVDGTGFLGVDHATQHIVVAFRGSKSVGNWLANANIVQKPFPQCVGCFVHSGFYDTWKLVKPIVSSPLRAASTQWPNYNIIVTGHSLGGAIATIAAADLRKTLGTSVDLYTYGAPMIGNVLFARHVTASSSSIPYQGKNYRVTHAKDLVPKLPGYTLGYAHISPEYWITSPTGDNDTTPSDIQVSSGPTNLKGNAGTLGSSVNDHSWYFGSISACGPDSLEFP